MYRKNFLMSAKLHTCCEIGDWKLFPQFISFKGGYAYATNSHVLVKCLISQISKGFSADEIAILDGKFLHMNSYKMLLGYNNVAITEAGFDCRKIESYEGVIIPFVAEKLICEIKFPNCDSLFNFERKDHIDFVGCDPRLITRLSMAMPSNECFKFEFFGELQAIKITIDDSKFDDCVGIFMPKILQN